VEALVTEDLHEEERLSFGQAEWDIVEDKIMVKTVKP